MLNIGYAESESEFIGHEPCPSCGSRDNLARYDDGHGFCFGCNYYEGNGNGSEANERNLSMPTIEVEYKSLAKRGITEETCRKFGYGVGTLGGELVQVAQYRSKDGSVIAQKIRTADKSFSILGNGKSLPLFGQHLWKNEGRMLVVTEGEIDALSVSQSQGNKWPVVSVSNGAAGAAKSIQRSIEYVEGFDNVIFLFDSDEQGQKAAVECALLIAPGKAKICQIPLKDPNEMLTAGREQELISSIWQSKVYRPDGVIDGVDMWPDVITSDNKPSIEYPWIGLQDKTLGIRQGEVVTLCSGTGQGKSLVCREWQHWLLAKGIKVGIISLEENVRYSAHSLMGLHLNCPPHKWELEAVTEEAKAEAFKATVGNGNCALYDHWGSLDSSNLLNRVRYMARGMGCTHLFLDHLSIVISGLGEGDERRLIDNLMTSLRSLVEELQISLFIVSHLRRPDGRAHEEGSVVSLSHLRGSASIACLSDLVIGLERDQQSEDTRNTTTIRVLKNRYSGDTGIACYVNYSPQSGRLTEAFDTTTPNEEEPPF